MIAPSQLAPGRFSTYLALTSFLIGTLLLILHLIFLNDPRILIIGYFYVLFAAIINGTTLIYLLFNYITNRFDKETLAIRILILLSNIPVTILYINIALHN